MTPIFFLFWLIVALPAFYLYVLAIASVRYRTTPPSTHPRHRFAITIPAHNEETVIANTVKHLRLVDYPRELFDIFVVADYCNDQTAENARNAGAICFERNEGPRGGKGSALQWLFKQIFSQPQSYDAIVVFDADTLVDRAFLRIMDARLQQGAQVVQGCHRIVNPQDSWLAAFTWAMFMVDNRFQNLGRSNLGWSAKNMGDSICFRTDILRRLGWGEGLTEDYYFRQRLLLEGIKIQYEPQAIGNGEAAVNWKIAQAQRARWLAGTYKASRRYAGEMLVKGLQKINLALLDGAAQAYLPSYSTLTVITALGLALTVFFASVLSSYIMPMWLGLFVALGLYPLFGLALERAPLRAFVAIWLGPFFIVWRTILGVQSRFGRGNVVWVRTARRDDIQSNETRK